MQGKLPEDSIKTHYSFVGAKSVCTVGLKPRVQIEPYVLHHIAQRVAMLAHAALRPDPSGTMRLPASTFAISCWLGFD